MSIHCAQVRINRVNKPKINSVKELALVKYKAEIEFIRSSRMKGRETISNSLLKLCFKKIIENLKPSSIIKTSITY